MRCRHPDLHRRGALHTLLAGVLLPLVGCDGGAARGPALRLGARLPPFTLPDLQGALCSSADMAGTPLFLNFWATWCPPCRAEMDALARLFGVLHSQGARGYAISIDADAHLVREFVLAMAEPVPVLLDPERAYAEGVLGLTAYPTSLLIDRGGAVAEVTVGPRAWDQPAVLAAVQARIL